MKRTLALSVAAPCCALAILLAACTGGGTAEPADDGQSIEQPAPKPEPPADPDTPDNPADPGTPNDPDNPDNPGEEAPAYKTVKEVLQEILGDDYNDISGEISQNITLTAQTIDAVTDIFPVLESVTKASDKDAEDKKMNEAKTKVEASTNDVKRALVAQAENKITLTKEAKQYTGGYLQYTFSGSNITETNEPVNGYGYNISSESNNVSLSGEFGYFSHHLESLSNNIDISKVTISSQNLSESAKAELPEEYSKEDFKYRISASALKKEIYDKLNLEGKDNNNLPTLDFELDSNYMLDGEFGLKHFLEIFTKYYKAGKEDNLKMEKLPFTEIDGRTLVEGVSKKEYTLFESDNNTVKESNDPSIKSFDVNELATFTDRYKISPIKNLIISGTPDSDITVNWDLTNIIFEKDMSKLTNISTFSLNGIVYFNDLPYNNKEVEKPDAYGIVKLNRLSYNFSRIGSHDNILDLRNVTEDDINKYDAKNGLVAGGALYVYFNKKFKNLAEGNNKDDFYHKFVNETVGNGGMESEYFGDDGVRQDAYKCQQKSVSSRTTRKLKDFEYYGNNGKYPTAALDSYEGYDEDYNKLSDDQKNMLNNDKNSGQNKYAKVTTLCPLC